MFPGTKVQLFTVAPQPCVQGPCQCPASSWELALLSRLPLPQSHLLFSFPKHQNPSCLSVCPSSYPMSPNHHSSVPFFSFGSSLRAVSCPLAPPSEVFSASLSIMLLRFHCLCIHHHIGHFSAWIILSVLCRPPLEDAVSILATGRL